MSYNYNNPKVREFLGLKQFSKHRVMATSVGDLVDNKPEGYLQETRFHGTRNPFHIEMAKQKAVRPVVLKKEKERVEKLQFVPDWTGWSRHVWNTDTFFGNASMKVTYMNISGYQVSPTFTKRSNKIVSNNSGLCVGLGPNKNETGKIVLSFPEPVSSVQFAVMSSSVDKNRKDAFTVSCNGESIGDGEFYNGPAINVSPEFVFQATKRTADHIGESDVLVKVVDDEITQVVVEFSNLDEDAVGGRVCLTDILYK